VGLSFLETSVPVEPLQKRAIAFVDGQNLYHAAKQAFGFTFPNYDVLALAKTVCAAQGWTLSQARFYTGVPHASDNKAWNSFWAAKLLAMSRAGVYVYSRPLRYRNQRVQLPGGREHTFLAAEEKGIDVRISLDIIRLGHAKNYDVAIVFSQDQDLSEVAVELRAIANEQGRWIKMASAFPLSPVSSNTRGINGTDWIRIDRKTYDACIDPIDYRSTPKRRNG
jgi:uncharacterized LabA/DUF88 family protein